MKKHRFVDISDLSLLLTGSSDLAEQGQTFMLMCTVNDASYMDDMIQFFTNDGIEEFSKDILVGSLHQNGNKCGVSKSGKSINPNFELNCGENTQTVSSKIKIYTLNIMEVSAKDEKYWKCQLSVRGIHSNTLKLTLYRE